MHKPPVPPKTTNMVKDRRPGLPPATPRSNGLALPSPGTQRRVKPALAPKPCLSKLTTAVESKPHGLKNQTSVAQHPQTVGLLNSKNGIQQQTKKPDWDYIVPICLCSQKSCKCIKSTSIPTDKLVENDLQIFHKGKTEENRKLFSTSHRAANNCEDRTDNQSHKTSTNPPQNVCLQPPTTDTHVKTPLTLGININTDIIASCPVLRPSPPNRTWSDEVNDNVMPPCAPGRELEEDALGSKQIFSVSQPKPVPGTPRPKPIPVPRNPRTTVVACQEKAKEVREKNLKQEQREMTAQEVNSLLDGKSSSSLAVKVPGNKNKQPAFMSIRKPCAPPAPPPRENSFLTVPEKVPVFAPQTPQKDVVEEDLGLDSSVYEMSVDKEAREVEKKGTDEQESPNLNITQCILPNNLFTQPELSKSPAVTLAAKENRVVKVPKKSQRHISPTPKKQPSEEKVGNLGDNEERQTLPSVMRELPLPPDEMTNRNLLTPRPIKPSRPSLGKARARSFSGADLNCSEGKRGDSFWKLLDLKLSVKNLKGKMGQNADATVNENEQSVDKETEECENFPEQLKPGRKFSCPLIGVEQNVDGDEFSPAVEQDVYYETINHYENIGNYMSTDVPKEGSSHQASQPTYHEMYNDEGIYEELYQTAYDRNSDSEEAMGDGPLEEEEEDDDDDDDDFTANTSDDDEDEFDTSSASSKGEPEQPEESTAQNGQKKSKIHHIATEIMSSESVFVDVLKLLHVDFRDAVSKASHQSGKPVIEERLLNQILYYLPQLYELNHNLLRELKERVAKWDENTQLADIFLKKGPFLKMYTIYICEFDKNVTLLEEQCKRNPAFGAVVQEFEASPRCANLALKHYLLKPVQRIPQYQLLLTDYLKNLSQDSCDYKDTQAALALVKEVASHANDTMKQGDNFQKLIEIQCSLIGHPEIVQPGRIFLKEGALMKLSRKLMQPRMFFLCNDVLLYTTPVQSGVYKLKNILSLAGMKVSKPSQEACQNELIIESVERSFILSASSATERDDWLEAVSTAINDYTRKKISFISGKSPEEVEPNDIDDVAHLGSIAPIWIPDLWTSMCTICASEFSVTRRRHHCRACGKVVCQSCSSNKHRLEYLKYQLARVCDQCFPILLQQKNEQPPLGAVSHGKLTLSRKVKKIPTALKEVSANTDSCSMSGYLQRSKRNKKQGKRLWFVIKNKVLYTYAASEDVVALESQPLLGLLLTEDSSENSRFKLYHKKTLYYIFKADDVQTAQRWIESFKEAIVL